MGMSLEQQVISLELAKKLKDLNVKQESLFYWHYDDHGNFPEILTEWDTKSKIARRFPDNPNWRWCSAFTVAELGEIIPKGYMSYQGSSGWFMDAREQDQMGWISKPDLIWERFETEADARADMLCHLIEKRIVKP